MKQAQPLMSAHAGGWKIVLMQLPAGASYGVLIGRPVPRASVRTIGLWVRGLVEIRNAVTNELSSVREPGTYSPDLPDFVPGRFIATALQDTQWWCLDAVANAGELPAHARPLLLAAGETAEVAQGEALLVCDGMEATRLLGPGGVIEGPASVQAAQDMRALIVKARA